MKLVTVVVGVLGTVLKVLGKHLDEIGPTLEVTGGARGRRKIAVPLQKQNTRPGHRLPASYRQARAPLAASHIDPFFHGIRARDWK